MIDGIWNTELHKMEPVRAPATVAIQRTVAKCANFAEHLAELRVLCAGCLDRILLEDY